VILAANTPKPLSKTSKFGDSRAGKEYYLTARFGDLEATSHFERRNYRELKPYQVQSFIHNDFLLCCLR
jgi:hypothetical protein